VESRDTIPNNQPEVSPRSSRLTLSEHLKNDRFRTCPVCQFIIDEDHDAALLEDKSVQR